MSTWRSSRCASALIAIAACSADGAQHAKRARHASTPSARPGWHARVAITIDVPTAVPLDDLPVPIRLEPERVDYARIAHDGHDLRVADPEGVDVPWELESFVPNKTSWLWVRVPHVAPGVPAKLELYFDNPKAPYLDSSESRDVWAAGYAGVYHIADDIEDSSPNRNPTSAHGMAPADGRIGQARYFSGEAADAITGTLPKGRILTVCAWAKTDSTSETAWIAGAGTVELVREGAELHCGGASAANVFAHDRWRYVCCVDRGGTATVYVDGAPSTHTGRHGANITGGAMTIGGAPWIGGIDEVRFSSVARDDDWIAAEHAAMTDVATFGEIEEL